jgi:hypothetical protein
MISEGGFHSNEVFETDNELAQKKVDMNIWPKNKKLTNKHVLYVYNKLWR